MDHLGSFLYPPDTQQEIKHPRCAKCGVPMFLTEFSLIFRITTSERLNAKRPVAPRR